MLHPLGGLLQTLALLHWEATLIQGLLQPLALLDWEATLIQGLLQPLAYIHEHGLLQPLGLLECQPTQIHEAVAASRPRSTPRSSGSPRLSDDA